MSGVNYSNASISKMELKAVEDYARSLASTPSTLGINWTNASGSYSIPTSINVGTQQGRLLIANGASSTWANGWSLDAANNRINFTGSATNKKFLVRLNLIVGPISTAGAGDLNLALNVNGTFQNATRQTFPSGLSSANWIINNEWAFTISTSQYIEIWGFISSGTASLTGATTTSFGGTSINQPFLSATIEEVLIP
jgi:hypothetical protein